MDLEHARIAVNYFQASSLALNDIITTGSLKHLPVEERKCLSDLVSGLEELSWAILSLQEGVRDMTQSPKDSH